MRALSVIPLACLGPLAGCGASYDMSDGGFDRARYQSELRLMCGMSLAMSGEINRVNEDRVCECAATRAVDGQGDEALRTRVNAGNRREQEGQIINACVAEERAGRGVRTVSYPDEPAEFDPENAQREMQRQVENSYRQVDEMADEVMRAEQESRR